MKDYKPEQRDRYELGFLLCPIRWPILWLPWQHCSFTGPTSIPSPLYALVFFLTLCLVGVKIERMENIETKIRWKTVFSTVWQIRENGEEENPGESFLSWAHNFHPPKSGGKSGEESAVKALLPKYLLPMSTTTQRGKIRRKQKITTKPSTTTKHRNLAQKTKTYHNQNKNSKPNQKI